MISIVICSKHCSIDSLLESNIKQTIGVEYEIVQIDNSHKSYSIFEAYNKGVAKAKGNILCFMHEDVSFHSNGWGKVVENYLAQDFVGALGIAGGNVVTDRLDWRFYGFGTMHLLQGSCTIGKKPHYYIAYRPQEKEFHPLSQVAAIDGVWMCFRKDIFSEIRFDEDTFHDFHLYDTDICMQVNKAGKGVFITADILLEHRSEGVFSEGYKLALEAFARKWKADLPMVKGITVTYQQIANALDAAQARFEARFKHDAVVIQLHKLFNSQEGECLPRDFTDEECRLMEQSLYEYCRNCIKDSTMTGVEVRSLIGEYMEQPFSFRKASLMLKYLWHRVLSIG